MLIAASAVMCLAVYYYAIKPTVILLESYQTQSDSIEVLTQMHLKKALVFEPLIKTSNAGSAPVRTREDLIGLLATITGTNACEIVEIPVHERNENDTSLKTINTIILKGTFIDLVKSLDIFEGQNTKSFSVLSSRFYISENPVSKTKQLLLSLKTRIYEKES
jgi:hypothetical protein